MTRRTGGADAAPAPRPWNENGGASRPLLLRAGWLPTAAALLMLLLGSVFFVYDEGREGFAELNVWFTWVEFICFGPGMALLVYVLIDRMRRREEYFAHQMEMAEREHLLDLGHLAAGVAHEVRNPLHNMRLIVDRLDGELDKSARERWRQRLVANLERVETAVELVFQQARKPEEQVHETVDLRQAVTSAAAAVGASVSWEEDGVPAGGALVSVPPEALRVILQNLLRNARDAGSDPSVVRLEARAGRFHLAIRNLGELDEQGVSSRSPNRLGIGLPLSRLLANRLDAQLDIEQSGSWVEATLDLPGRGAEAT